MLAGTTDMHDKARKFRASDQLPPGRWRTKHASFVYQRPATIIRHQNSVADQHQGDDTKRHRPSSIAWAHEHVDGRGRDDDAEMGQCGGMNEHGRLCFTHDTPLNSAPSSYQLVGPDSPQAGAPRRPNPPRRDCEPHGRMSAGIVLAPDRGSWNPAVFQRAGERERWQAATTTSRRCSRATGAIASERALVVSEVIDPALMAAVLPMHACQNKTKKSSSHSYCWPAGRPQLALSCMSRKTQDNGRGLAPYQCGDMHMT